MSFDKLTDIEKKKMYEMRDDRSISGDLLTAFSEDGKEFNEFKKYVDGKKEFAVCLRGNSEPACITIYHNNHMVWGDYSSSALSTSVMAVLMSSTGICLCVLHTSLSRVSRKVLYREAETPSSG